jgi:hypothetical protein
MVTQGSNKNLCLVLQPTKSLGMDDTVTVTLKTGPYGAWLFPPQPTTTELTLGSIRGKRFFFLLCLLTNRGLGSHGIIVINQPKKVLRLLPYRRSPLILAEIQVAEKSRIFQRTSENYE